MRLALTFNERHGALPSVAEAEFDTPATIAMLVDHLASLGHDVIRIEVSGPIARLCERLAHARCDLIFNIAEGTRGRFREAFYPALFEQLGLAHTHSSATTLAVCLDKALTKRLVAAAGMRVARGVLVRNADAFVRSPDSFVRSPDSFVRMPDNLVRGPDNLVRMPDNFVRGQDTFVHGCDAWIVKPNYEGASKGITAASIARSRAQLDAIVERQLRAYPDGVLVEEFVDGVDVSIAWLAGVGTLPAIGYRLVCATDQRAIDDRITDGRATEVYDYERKHLDLSRVRVEIPAALDELVAKRLANDAERVFEALGVEGIGRADFRITPGGDIVFLEMNPLPALGDGELFAAAALVGLAPRDVLARVIDAAGRRMPGREDSTTARACGRTESDDCPRPIANERLQCGESSPESASSTR